MTCRDCLHYEACGGYLPTDLDKDVFDLCRQGRTDEITDIDKRCSDFEFNYHAQLAAAWDEFKKEVWDEFTNSKTGKFVIRIADKLTEWLERNSGAP